ncbi:aminotransferase class I/II-fold pyridoxal phosphate-dependent enzyme [Crocinitomix catalasitica]|nr:aminotransferase class I/II-fold pyridoxal phosphate-dependent enzyme [Crocinitomix catalasitica]
MPDLFKKLEDLGKISAKLEPGEEERDNYLLAIKEYSNWFLGTIEDRPSYQAGRPNSDKLAYKGGQISLEQALKVFKEEVNDYGINPAGGGHLGYIPGGGIYLAAIGDYLAAVSNEYAGVYFGGPGAVTMENELINWMKDVFGFPESAVGNLCSGGSIANLIALTAARDKFGIKNEKITKSVVYLSPQVHHCIQKAIRIIGLEDTIVRDLELDDDSRIVADKVAGQIEADKAEGLNPFLIIASAGTTDTGAVDPLNAIADIAEENNIWYHIDAAYGGFFVLCDEVKHLFKGIDRADSLVIDPHKGLFLPYGLGAVIVKDKEALFQSHHYTANYMRDALDPSLPLTPADVSPELTKHFRGMRLWLPLQIHGLEPFIACLAEKLYLTTYFRSLLKEAGFALGPEPDLSVSYFWHETDACDQNEFNKKFMHNIHLDGQIFLSSTMIDENTVIRIALLSFRTKKRMVDSCMEMILRCFKKTKREFGIS